MLKSWKFWLGLLLLAGLAWWVGDQYGWRNLMSAWERVPPESLTVALLLMLVSYLLRAVRFFDFFMLKSRRHFVRLLRITVLHNFFNNMLPMRSGEASFPLLMKDYFAVPYRHSAPALLWLRLLDLYVLLALAFISLQSLLPWSFELKVLVSVLVVLAPLSALLVQERLRRWLQSQDAGGWHSKAQELMSALPDSPWRFTRALFWTLVNWLIKLVVYAWLLQVFTGLDFYQCWSGATTGELSSVLPVHGLAGAGTYEAGVMAGLLPWQVDAKEALAAAVNLHLFVLGTTLLLTGLLVLLTQRLRAAGG